MKKYSILFLILCVSFQVHAQKHVVISEVMYDSPLNEQIGLGTPYSNGEYIELYNLEETAVDLSGWKLTGGGSTETYTFPAGTVIRPKEYLIVAYRYNNSGFSLYSLFSWDGYMDVTLLYQRKLILANSGETVSVIDNAGRTVDRITYDGTSNKTKPGRLSAGNEDRTSADYCVSLHRKRVVCDGNRDIVFDPSHWAVAGYTPFEGTYGIVIENPFEKPSQDKNYVVETIYTASDEGTEVVTYYDDLGRLAQTIAVGASPVDGKNIVSFVEYDQMGRADSVSYLPYVADSQSAVVRTNPLAEQQNFYTNRYTYDYQEIDGDYAYATKKYDNSGLGLTIE